VYVLENIIIQTTGEWRKSNVAACYIQIKAWLGKLEIAREATEVTKPGRVKSSWFLWYGKKQWEPRIWFQYCLYLLYRKPWSNRATDWETRRTREQLHEQFQILSEKRWWSLA